MDLESVVYGLIAGAIIMLMAYTFGYCRTFDQRMQRLGYWFIAIFLLIVLQWSGRGAAFAMASLFAAIALFVYLGVRKIVVRQPR